MGTVGCRRILGEELRLWCGPAFERRSASQRHELRRRLRSRLAVAITTRLNGPDGVVAGGKVKTFGLVEGEWKMTRELGAHANTGAVYAVCFSASGRFFASVDYAQGRLKIFEAATGSKYRKQN